MGNEFLRRKKISETLKRKYRNGEIPNVGFQKGSKINKGRIFTKEFSQWRKQVFERDNYTCQKCSYNYKYDKPIKRELHPHHIFTFSKLLKTPFEKHIFSIDNGITLCEKCHYYLHYEKI